MCNYVADHCIFGDIQVPENDSNKLRTRQWNVKNCCRGSLLFPKPTVCDFPPLKCCAHHQLAEWAPLLW